MLKGIMDVFLLTLEQVALMLIFIFVGYFFRKKNIINDSGKKVLAGLLVNLFMPCYSIASLSQQLSADKIVEYLLFLLAGTAMTFFVIFIALPFAKAFGKTRLQQNILKYAFAFGNIGYFGYPVVGAVFGEPVKALMILFCIPMTIGINTYGWQILTEKETSDEVSIEKKKKWTDNLRFLYAVPFIGTMLGLIIGLLPITLPKFAVNIFDAAGDCQSVTAMLLTGAVLASVPFGKLFTSVKPYIIGVIKLLVFPVIVGAIMVVINLCGVRGETFQTIARLCIIISALPVGMNVVVYPESCGMDATEGAKTCFMSYVLALAALPVVFMLMELIVVNFI